MADVITFSCSQCQMPFRVASANAGRAFACKNCGTQLVVPSASTPMAPVVVPQEPEVQLGAGQQVIRKTDSARRASVDPTRMITRNSGAHPAVAPAHAAAPVAAPAAKSKLPLFAGVGVVAVVAIVVGLWAAGVFNGNVPAQPGANGPVAAGNNPGSQQKEPPEREKILLELNAPSRTGPGLIELYTRAKKVPLDKTDLGAVAREAADRIQSENGEALTDAQILDFGEVLAADGYVAEPGRLYLIVVRRHKGKAGAPETYARAQKLRKLEKIDFTPVLARADEAVQSGVIDDAKGVREELVKLSDASEDGWVDSANARRFEELEKQVTAQLAEVERLKKEDPFRFVVARSRQVFSTQRVSSRNEWGVFASEPVIVYYERRKGEIESADEAHYRHAIQGIVQFVAFWKAEFAPAMGLPRVLPLDAPSQADRDAAPFEVLLFADRASWRPYLSDIRARVDTNRQSHHTDLASGRLSYLFEGTEASLVNLMTMMTHHCLDTWHPRVKETKDKPALQTFVLETILPAAISLCRRTPEGDDLNFEFFHHDDRWIKQMHKWRKPFAVAANGGIDSFGGPAVTLRDIVGATGGDDFIAAFEKNIRTYKGWEEDRIKGVADSMRTPNSQTLTLVLNAYFRGFAMFLWHFEKGGKPKYRERFLKFLVADLKGEVKHENQVEQFAQAFGLDDKGWKEIEADFLAYQTAP